MAELSLLAVKRLQQDLKELNTNPPLPMKTKSSGKQWGIDAKPRDESLKIWDVKMMAASGALAGREVNMELIFDSDYPYQPPQVRLLTPITNHPNVFGDWICLDMLKDAGAYAKPYMGWSTAYRVSGILLQLYGFLLVDEVVYQMSYNNDNKYDVGVRREGYSRTSSRVVSNSRPLKRSLPLAVSLAPVPSLRKTAVSPNVSAGSSSQPAASPLSSLDDHLLRHVLEFCDVKDLLQCMGTAPSRLAHVAADVKQRKELECFFTRSTYKDTVLGFGVRREWHAPSRRGAARGLKSLVVRLDYLSLEAFVNYSVRRSAWNAFIDAFLPLYLNPLHGQKALAALPSCVEHILSTNAPLPIPVSNASRAQPTVAPRQLLTVISQAMNSLVVEMCRVEKGDMPLHMSDAALKGFAHLHHLLLAVATCTSSGPALIGEARRDVEAFISRGAARHKSVCPDLGVLVVELLLVPKEEVPWERFLPPFLRELLARGVMWALKGGSTANTASRNNEYEWFDFGGCQCASCRAARAQRAAAAKAKAAAEAERKKRAMNFGIPIGEDLCGDSWHSYERMKTHYESQCTGLRAMQLTCWFGLELARPKTTAGIMNELRTVKSSYDDCSGAPRADKLQQFHAFASGVMKGGGWAQVLSGLRAAVRYDPPNEPGGKPDPRRTWANTLRQAVIDSWVAGYHEFPQPWGNGPPRQAQQQANAGKRQKTDDDGWTVVKRNGDNGDVSRPWGSVHAPRPERLMAVRTALGMPYVDWEGDNKPVVALVDAL